MPSLWEIEESKIQNEFNKNNINEKSSIKKYDRYGQR